MADPLTFIGLASNIIAFIDFGMKLVSSVKSIQDSAQGALPEISELGLIVNDIRMANANLKMEISSQSHLSPQDESILAMATECVRLGDQLHSLIDELKLRDNNLPRRVESGRVYLRTWRKRKEIDNLRGRLETLDDRISKSVKLSLQRELGSTIKADLHAFQKLQLELDIKYESRFDGIQGMIEQLKEQEHRTEVRQLDDLKCQLHILEKERYICQRQCEVIQSLYFPELRRRWSKIPCAERGTNDWLFDRSKTAFVDWLELKDGIYWISGRAGSGKSTLMKFASEHKITLSALETWSDSKELHTASYYFWNQGFEMQKSQTGLLQSLLYQILRRSPSLVLSMCPDRPAHERWEVEDLKAAYRWIAEQEHLPAKYCFFIDGLDEYDGDEEEAVKMLSFLCISRHIKICVSSRPRTIFEDAFRDSRFTFAIQDYTSNDMKIYVQKQLDESFGDPQSSCSDLTTQISEQAQGVWLWVFLITRDLERAIRRKEEISTLQRLVREFPPDLEAYFEHIISRIDKRYRREMAQIFLVAIEEVQPLPLFAFSLLEKEGTVPDYALEARISPLDDKTSQIEGLWDRIQARCSDLLVIDDIPHPTFLDKPVDFLHRTVRDYLQDCYYQQLRSLAQGFNPLISLCKITLYMLKRLPEPDFKNKTSSSIHRVIGLVDELLYYAHEDEKKDQSPESSLVDILDELDRVNNYHSRHIRNHWTHARDPPTTRGLDEYHEGGNCTFLALAIQARLTKYVRAKLQSDRSLMVKKKGRPLLDYALRPLRLTAITMPYHSQREDPSVDVRMVQLLLQYGANPNQPVYLHNDRTVWVLFLLSCYEYTNRDVPSAPLRNAWCQAAELLIKQGAKLDHSFGKHSGHLSAHEILETRIFGPQKAAVLEKIMKEAQMQQSTEPSSWLPKVVKANLKRALWWQRV